MQNQISARLIAAEEREYQSFTDDKGVEKPAGRTYRLWLSENFTSAPVEARCSGEHYREALGLGAGAQVDATIEVKAQANRLAFKVVAFAKSTAELASLNGRKTA
jgi:hypothetical protein